MKAVMEIDPKKANDARNAILVAFDGMKVEPFTGIFALSSLLVTMMDLQGYSKDQGEVVLEGARKWNKAMEESNPINKMAVGGRN